MSWHIEIGASAETFFGKKPESNPPPRPKIRGSDKKSNIRVPASQTNGPRR